MVDTYAAGRNGSLMAEHGLTNLLPTSATITNPYTDRKESQYILIGVYTFFVTAFVLCLFVLLIRRTREACCKPSSGDLGVDYESVRNDNESGSRNDQICNHHNTYQIFTEDSDVDMITTIRYTDDSEYDNVSLDGGRRDSDETDKPPEYDHPPPYTAT